MNTKERCDSCGRYKLYNTGGGLICTNLNCRDGISVEQDHKEVDALRKNFISSKPPVIKSLPDFELRFCEKCFQMTNHIKNECQKCKGNVL